MGTPVPSDVLLPRALAGDFAAMARLMSRAEAGVPDEKALLPQGGAGSDLGQPKVRDRRFIGRHNGAGIIGFADGHAEVVPVDRAFDTNVVRWELAAN